MRKLMKKVEEIITADDDLLVPARKVYFTLKYQQGEKNLPSFPEFIEMLKRSRKFELVQHVDDFFYDLPESVEQLLYKANLYGSGPLVKLKAVNLTPELMRVAYLRNYERLRAGVETLIAEISSNPDVPEELVSELVSAFTGFREQINRVISMIEKLELYEATAEDKSVKKRKKK